jgi:hypothetical protein
MDNDRSNDHLGFTLHTCGIKRRCRGSVASDSRVAHCTLKPDVEPIIYLKSRQHIDSEWKLKLNFGSRNGAEALV